MDDIADIVFLFTNQLSHLFEYYHLVLVTLREKLGKARREGVDRQRRYGLVKRISLKRSIVMVTIIEQLK